VKSFEPRTGNFLSCRKRLAKLASECRRRNYFLPERLGPSPEATRHPPALFGAPSSPWFSTSACNIIIRPPFPLLVDLSRPVGRLSFGGGALTRFDELLQVV
jgi:hypothetical protein